MRTRWLAVGVAALATFASVSCRKLEQPHAAPTGPSSVTLAAVPAELGELVAVTSAPGWPDSAELWFVKPDKSIAMIAVDMRNVRLSPTVVQIPRN